jgi:hypothetical protein
MSIKETPEAAALLDAYSEWLANERTALHRERFGDAWRETMAHVPVTPAHEFHFQWRGGCVTNPVPPSHRAASVLEHVGANWRDTEAQPEAGDGEPMAPDEITLTPFGAAVMARMKERAGDAQPQDEDEAPLPELSEEELDAIFGDDATAYDFSVEASITSHQAAWRDVAKIKDMIAELSPGPAQADMGRLIDRLDSWFENGVDRLAAMQTARRAESP